MKNYHSAFVQTTYLTTTALSLAAFVTPSCARSEEDAVRATPVVSFVAARADQKIITFDAPFLFTYLAWENKAKIENNKAYLNAPGMTPKGGGGSNITLDLSASAKRCPTVRVKVGAKNTLRTLKLLLIGSQEGATQTYDFPLPTTPTDDFITLFARDGATLSAPSASAKGGVNLAKITQWQLQGDFGGDGAVDVVVESVSVVEPSAEMKAVAEAARATSAKADADAKAWRERDAADNQAKYGKRSAASPTVIAVSRVAPDILAVLIESGKIAPGRVEDYVSQPGDTRRAQDKAVILTRNGADIGYLIGVKKDSLAWNETFSGDPLLDAPTEDAANYSVTGADAGLAAGMKPVALWRKSRPVDWAQPGNNGFVMHHTVYLKLPRPLTSGNTYTVRFGDAVNVQKAEAVFVCDDAKIRSEAVHVNQIGFRADDPLKQGFLSIWLGTGGGYEYAAPPAFAVVDAATGKSVFSGIAQKIKGKDDTEKMWLGKTVNYTKTAVYRLDFSGLATPGKYRLSVAGVGASYPFTVGQETWKQAFRVQMRGLFHERSGMVLGPPYTPFRKPRDFHPADPGVSITQSTWATIAPISGDAPKNIAAGDTGKTVPEAWGGYHDAGDWNPRRVTHMKVTLSQLELFELYPAFFAPMKLNIPPRKNVPDVLTEALFELDCFRRLQKPDGGVPHEIETDGDPITGEVSWKQSMPAYVSAPDVRGSWYYTLVAAKMAKVVAPYDAPLAKTYTVSAAKAFAWAERDRDKRKAAGKLDTIPWDVRDMRNLAALNLYALTGDPAYNAVFLQDTLLKSDGVSVFQWGTGVQRDAAFVYATLPATRKPDPAIKARAIAALTQQADSALAYASGNAFGIATPDPGKPMFVGFWSAPDAVELCRAHYLTGDAKYLAGALQASVFSGGGNPHNMTYTSGLGANPVKHPFHIDYRATGQATPAGFTTYGNFDWVNWGDQEWATWPLRYFLGAACKPTVYDWPMPEAYFDIYRFIAQNEWTVDAWSPNVYVWGYLAARK